MCHEMGLSCAGRPSQVAHLQSETSGSVLQTLLNLESHSCDGFHVPSNNLRCTRKLKLPSSSEDATFLRQQQNTFLFFFRVFMLIAASLCYQSTGEPISSAIARIRRDIITVIQTSHLTHQHSLSDATDSQLCYCDTESRLRQTHISMLDCLLSCYNCCGSL